jgi:hypothetical protein
VSDWQVVYLGVMAAALAIMAIVQIGVIIVAIRLGKQLSATVDEIRREVRPLIEKAHRISDDAARATSLAVAQIEKMNQLLTTTSSRVSETLGLVQHAVVEPVRQGAAVVAAVRAAVSAFRSWRASHHTREDDDALFVG